MSNDKFVFRGSRDLSKKLTQLTAVIIVSAIAATSQFCLAAGTSVKDYISIALEKSPSITQAKLSLEKSELDLVTLKLQDSVLSAKQLDISTKRSMRSFESAKRDLALNVETSYLGLLKAQKALEIAEQTNKQSASNLQMVKARFDQKVASKLDLISAENGAKQAEIGLRRAANSLTQAKSAFQRLVGVSEDIAISDVTLNTAAVDMTLDQVAAMAIEKSLDLEFAKDDLDLAQLKKSLTENEFTSVNEKRKAEIAVVEAQMALDQKNLDVVKQATNLYISVKDAKDQIEIATRDVDYAQESLRVTNLRYSAGLETASALINSQISLTRANISLLDATSNYKSAVSQLLSYIGAN